MSFALDIVTITAVSAGAFFFLAGTVGLLRFPDPLTRLHALTKADNLGLGLVVLGTAAAGRKSARRAQAGLRLAARAAGRRNGLPAHRARRAGERSQRSERPARQRSMMRAGEHSP